MCGGAGDGEEGRALVVVMAAQVEVVVIRRW